MAADIAVIDPDAYKEYRPKLEELGDEYALLKKTIDRAETRKKEISNEIKVICTNVGGDEHRVLLPTPGIEKAWDRRVSHKGGGLDYDLLRDKIGNRRFRNLCDAVKTITLNPAKLEAARMAGRITEAEMSAATRKGAPSFSLYQLDKSEVNEDDLGDLTWE